MPGVLILSNEVVKMRGEVKRIRVLLIRKIIRQISVLEKKKGSEAVLEKFRRRVDRLREEIHELKTISPDSITKAALQKDISFEKVCQNKEASLSERAIARVATHPQFSKKIQRIKAAIKAFKEERINALNDEKQAKNNAENSTSLDQSQADSDDDDDLGLEKSSDEDNEDEKLKEDKGDKKTDEDRQQEIDGSTEESQKTSVETINEQTNQCQKEELLSVEKSSETVGIPEEVIRMRKEVKRTRVLIISKMAEQVASLKKKKKKSLESEVKESQEKAAEIMKEIKALRSLNLDQVTMTALQENVDFEKVLQDSQASPVDRAIAHITTNSRFINKLQKVKEAIKEERAKAEQKKMDKLDTVQSKNEDVESKEGTKEDEESEEELEEDEESEEELEEDEKSEEETEDDEESKEETEDDEESEKERENDEKPNDDICDHSKEEVDVIEEKLNSSNPEILMSSVAGPTESKDSDLVIVPHSKIITTSPKKSKSVEIKSQKAEATAPNIKSYLEKPSTVSKKNISQASKEMKATLKPQKKKDLPETKRVEADKDKEESDLSEEEEEKEYFDDSTEERFHKQSSQSEESDDDDFFLGKVSKFKKRKSKVEEKKSELQKTDKEATGKPHETNLGKLQSVFCSVLSKSSVSSQKAKFGSRSDGSRPPRFQNQRKGPEGRMKASQYKGQDPGADRRTGPFKPNRETFKGAAQNQAGPSGAVRERPQFEQKRNPRGPPGRMSDPPKQALHPSWEASKKRKEQQSKITVFQGKKIKFDDDD